MSYTAAAKAVGRRSGDAVSHLVSRFNREGLAALEPGHGGGRRPTYAAPERERILEEVRREPDREEDGTATWSLSTLRRALGGAPDGLPEVSTPTPSGRFCERPALSGRGLAVGVRPAGSSASAKVGKRWKSPIPMPRLKNLIERAYREGEKKLGISVWGLEQAGPFQTMPYPGASWELQGKPACQPHQHLRNGTAKLMSLFHPATGKVRVKGVRSCTNAVLHPWLKQELEAVL
jgi:hypothetical protein